MNIIIVGVHHHLAGYRLYVIVQGRSRHYSSGQARKWVGTKEAASAVDSK